MIPGYVFVILGLLLVAIGSFIAYYGQVLYPPQQAPAIPSESRVVLNPPQERLLEILYNYQKQFAVHKLIVNRDGGLFFDEPERKNVSINVASDLYGGEETAKQRASEFVALMDSMPEEYLRRIPETRLDSPFVVTVTGAGVRYLKAK